MSDFLKIDIHTHILPERWPDLRERYGYGGWVRLEHHCPGCAKMMVDDRFLREIESNSWDPDTRIGDCDAEVVIDYRVYAFDLSVRGAYLDHTRAFLTVAASFSPLKVTRTPLGS